MVRPRFVSIRFKLAIALILFLTLTLGALGLFLNLTITRTLTHQTKLLEQRYAQNIQQSINQVLFAGKYQVQAYIESLVKRDPKLYYVAVIDRQTGLAIAHSDPALIGTRFDDPLTQRGYAALHNDHPVVQDTQSPSGEPLHDVSLPYLRGYLQEPAGIIRIGNSAADLQEVMARARAVTMAFVLSFLVAGVLLAFGLTLRLTAGLNQLVGVVKRFGEGDTHATVSESRSQHPDEIDLLGITFNQMAHRLQDYAGELEQQIEDRTRELAQANESLREREAILSTVVTNAPLMLYSLDRNGIITFSEGKGLSALGFRPEELVGKSVFDLYSRGPALENSRRALAGETITGSVNMGEVILDSWMVPMRDAQGAIAGVIGVAVDVTERWRLEEQLRGQYERLKELDRLKSNFVNAVTHELRTPLTSIIGYAEFLEDEIGGRLSSVQQEFVSQIQRGSRRLEFLLNDLLDFARIEAGTFRLRLADADLGKKIRDIVESMRPQAEEAFLSLQVSLPEDLPVIRMDAQRVGQVLINLIGNALKFTPAGGRITVGARVEGESVRCEVSDTGIGIAPEDLPRLFQRFSQLESGVKQGKGAGLGLSISKALIEAHGGQIGVASQPGYGSTFWFTLPVAGRALEAPPEAEEPPLA